MCVCAMGCFDHFVPILRETRAKLEPSACNSQARSLGEGLHGVMCKQ